MAAVKSPYGAQTLFPRSFSPIPDSPWPNSATVPTANAAHGNMFPQHRSNLSASQLADEATTPSDITAPSPSTSETSTVFTDVDGDEPRSAQPESDDEPSMLEIEPISAASHKSLTNALKIDTIAVGPGLKADDDEPPQSVIHIPSGFGRFHQTGSRPSSRLSAGRRSHRSTSQSSTASNPVDPQTVGSGVTRPSTAASANTESTVPSESTLRAEAESHEFEALQTLYDHPMPFSPINTQLPSQKDWASTPRAQTRQELSFSRPGSSLASIREGDDDTQSEHFTTDVSESEHDPFRRRGSTAHKSINDIEKLEVALAECWTLCNTLATLSNRHRDGIFSKNPSTRSDMHEQAWKSCWKLCQNLYETRDHNATAGTKNTLSLCREFCQALFEVRVRKDEHADSVLRVSFELNNHLFNTHDRTLPEAFRERTLDFYVTLCHRLMKQKSKLAAETDSLLRACWTLAEMLFTLRQSRRENRQADHDLLASAMQACWDLCNLFREGWTAIRPDRGTPKATQTTFSQAFALARRAGYIEDQNTLKITPETPTTIFDDTATISPDEAPVPSISVMDHGIPQSARSTASAPLPRPNTTQRVSRAAMMQRAHENRWNSINEVLSEEDAPSRPESAMSHDSRASSQMSLASSLASSQRTMRTPAEDPSLTLLKALFVRAAVQTGRGFSADPRNATARDSASKSLPLFTRSLPDTAFGTQAWQRNLLAEYKKCVSQDNTFKYLGTTAAAIGLGPDPDKGREEIAGVLKGMVDNTPGWGWLRELFRYGYGQYPEEVLNKTKEPPAPTAARAPTEVKVRPAPNSRTNSNTSNGTVSLMNGNGNGNGNEGRKISPPRR